MTGRKPVCEYEELRQRNLEDNKVILAKLMKDLAKVSPIPIAAPRKQRKPQTKRVSTNPDEPLVVRRNPPRSARYTPVGLSPHVRARRGSVSSSVSSASGSTDSTPTKSGKFIVRFGAFMRRSFDDNDDTYSDEEYDNEDERALPAVKRKPRAIRIIKAPLEITEQDLIRVAVHVSDKKYDNYYGTSCHQCRQKTDDQKTICHSDSCFGVRGQFCGPCLKNRYGEDAKESLKNPEWICPPCRGICNCSFCRKKAGKCSTGILIHLAREHGYKDVNAYLESFRKS